MHIHLSFKHAAIICLYEWLISPLLPFEVVEHLVFITRAQRVGAFMSKGPSSLREGV